MPLWCIGWQMLCQLQHAIVPICLLCHGSLSLSKSYKCELYLTVTRPLCFMLSEEIYYNRFCFFFSKSCILCHRVDLDLESWNKTKNFIRNRIRMVNTVFYFCRCEKLAVIIQHSVAQPYTYRNGRMQSVAFSSR